MARKELIQNRKARHDFEILETFEAGIVLRGTEIKSLKDHQGSLQEAYVKVLRDEVWLIGCHIPPYRYGNIHNHEEMRDKKLLLHKAEIRKLKQHTDRKGLTIVPLTLYLMNGYAKLSIATARGKQKADKRQAIKEREQKREIDRALKQKKHS